MTECNDLAFAAFDGQSMYHQPGLTKREYFAAMAMQGILACSHLNQSASYESIGIESVNYADALIKELNK